MHILILPSYLYQTEHMPLAGIFQKHQANCLIAAGFQVGVLSAGLLPFKSILRANLCRNTTCDEESGVCVVRRYRKALMPQRFISADYQADKMRSLGLAAFDRYVAEYGMPDIAHAHDCLYAGVLAQALKERYGLPYMITEHSSAHGRNLYTEAQEAYIRLALKDAAVITTVGSSTAAILQGKYGAAIPAANHISVIYNLLESSFEDAELPTPAKNEECFTFLNVANLIELKKHKNLIAAFRQVLDRHPNARLRIGGSGPMREELDRAISEAGLAGKANLLGYLTRPEVIREMSACGAFVLSSDIETFGVVLIEAMALGKPVISTRCGGPEDIVDDLCGYLVPVGDVDAMARAMEAMLQNINRFDPATIREHCVERYGREAFLQRLEGIYRDVLESEHR